MNKEIKNSIKILSEKENQRAEAISKAEADLKEYRSRLADLRDRVKKAEADPETDPEEYKILVREMRDTEAVVQFCENRVRLAENIMLTAEEYSIITSETKQAYDGIKADCEKSVCAEVDKLVKILTAYDEGVQDLNKIRTSAGNLMKKTPVVLSADTVGILGTDNLTDPYRYFVQAYFNWKRAVYAIGHNGGV